MYVLEHHTHRLYNCRARVDRHVARVPDSLAAVRAARMRWSLRCVQSKPCCIVVL